MIFSSLGFIYIFLPVAVAGFLGVRALWGTRAALSWLSLVSVVFYGMWRPAHVPLLVGSVLGNYWIAGKLGPDRPRGRALLATGVAANLGLLFWFKYAAFASRQLVRLGLLSTPFAQGELPLAISFFTFQQIAYLVDIARGEAERAPLLKHLLFVSFFPHLIAGPITHPATILPQLDRPRPTWLAADLGVFVFALGLAKKTLLADPIGEYVNTGFGAPEALACGNAWAAVLGFALQIYFDFSGYSDMAVGLGLLFGIQLPWNFRSPYRSASIVEFWRRWHVTLSDFLKRYLYIPLGGSRVSPERASANLAVTMFLGGLWHGAGYTFILWGMVHGLALIVNHGWRRRRLALPRPLAWGATMLVVVLAWVLFRAPSVEIALRMYARMFGAGAWFDFRDVQLLATAPYLAVGLGVVLAAPSTAVLAERFAVRRSWRVLGALAMAVSLVYLLGHTKPPEFIYFDF